MVKTQVQSNCQDRAASQGGLEGSNTKTGQDSSTKQRGTKLKGDLEKQVRSNRNIHFLSLNPCTDQTNHQYERELLHCILCASIACVQTNFCTVMTACILVPVLVLSSWQAGRDVAGGHSRSTTFLLKPPGAPLWKECYSSWPCSPLLPAPAGSRLIAAQGAPA